MKKYQIQLIAALLAQRLLALQQTDNYLDAWPA